MTELALSFPKRKELEILESHDDSTLRLALIGTADMRLSNELCRYLSAMHERVISMGLSRVIVDVTRLDFMNSSCFKGFVAWVAKLQTVDEAKRYGLVLQSDPSVLWQRRSLQALTYFAAGAVSIETVEHHRP